MLLSLALLDEAEVDRRGLFLCATAFDMPARRAPGGMWLTVATRLLTLSKN